MPAGEGDPEYGARSPFPALEPTVRACEAVFRLALGQVSPSALTGADADFARKMAPARRGGPQHRDGERDHNEAGPHSLGSMSGASANSA
jgi:hypothetical protein